MRNCETCGKSDDEKPMTYRGEKYCSERCRKVQAGEVKKGAIEEG